LNRKSFQGLSGTESLIRVSAPRLAGSPQRSNWFFSGDACVPDRKSRVKASASSGVQLEASHENS
jgi:hypothetical protein